MAVTKTNINRERALWYAMGREDAGESLPSVPEDFAREYADARMAYDSGSGFMPSMKRAFRMWKQGKPVTDES